MTDFSNFSQTCTVSGKILHSPYKVYGKGPNFNKFKKNQPSIIRLLKLRFEFFGLLPTAKINDDNLETQLTNVNRYDDIRILSIYVCRFFFLGRTNFWIFVFLLLKTQLKWKVLATLWGIKGNIMQVYGFLRG